MTRKEYKNRVDSIHHALVFRSQILAVIFFVLMAVIPAFIPALASVPWLVWGIPGIVGLYWANRKLVRWGNKQLGL